MSKTINQNMAKWYQEKYHELTKLQEAINKAIQVGTLPKYFWQLIGNKKTITLELTENEFGAIMHSLDCSSDMWADFAGDVDRGNCTVDEVPEAIMYHPIANDLIKKLRKTWNDSEEDSTNGAA